jgi:hypothetical protein
MKGIKMYLDIFNVILCIIIMGLVIFGSNKKCKEGFENVIQLSSHQQNFLQGVQSGILDNASIQSMIREGGIQKDDVQRIIDFLASQQTKQAEQQPQ